LIFVCVGSREYPFDRLLKKIDELVLEKVVSEKIFAQIGQSTYLPQTFEYVRFLSAADFEMYQNKADLIISHAGTGALISALKKGKQVIAVPRLAKYGEHIDDHQIQIAEVLEAEGYLRNVLDINELCHVIRACRERPITKRYLKKSNVLDIIINYINEN
jgi:UDP-N-acetylglucosamine transferase subunit ALG13